MFFKKSYEERTKEFKREKFLEIKVRAVADNNIYIYMSAINYCFNISICLHLAYDVKNQRSKLLFSFSVQDKFVVISSGNLSINTIAKTVFKLLVKKSLDSKNLLFGS